MKLDNSEHQHHLHGQSCKHQNDNTDKNFSHLSTTRQEKQRINYASSKDQAQYRQQHVDSEVNDLNFKPVKDMSNKESENATRQLDINTEFENDAITQAKKNIEITKGIMEGKLKTGVYRGEHGYMNLFNQTEEDLKHKVFTGTLGPIRAPTFIRNTTRVDYNPELCKDYFETGKCGFGDSCIFIHDRSDYKPGWLLDQEFDKEQRKRQAQLMGQDVSDEEENYEIPSENSQGELDDDGLPIQCRICEQVFRSPIVTICNHYFCERCALDNYMKSSDCFNCGKPTNGIFNEAPKLLKKSNKLLKTIEQQDDGEESHDIQEGIDENQSDEENTTVSRLKQNSKKVDESSDSNEQGVISKEDKEVFKQYKKQFVDIDKKKYTSQTGWFIP
ncbi:zinc finger protein 183 [Stylonychia lemnae]|uniref:Zinc finger protein 183 n=1 Tax=Stylonychia lemnae TaxID=5949 RepID=A0A078B4D5_STYLE|nr:zinc finger protein 183 [Stylonychia lemnae]|eukprot:CDW89126.1 zinc finger protein 183 [Stylonychia lemnae]